MSCDGFHEPGQCPYLERGCDCGEPGCIAYDIAETGLAPDAGCLGCPGAPACTGTCLLPDADEVTS